MKSSSPVRILILGGGFGGVYAAMELEKLLGPSSSEAEVTLVSEENFFLFTPMLHEVAASDVEAVHIVSPIRRLLRHTRFFEAEVRHIDLAARRVTVGFGAANRERDLDYDLLVIASGAETNYFGMADVEAGAVTLKTLTDAVLLRNRILALFESASLEEDESLRRKLLGFVVAGGGFAGVETIGAVNDFVRESLRWYPQLREEEVRIVLAHPKEVVLPELGEALGRYAQEKLVARKVEIRTNTKVTGYQDATVSFSQGGPVPAATLIWTSGVTPGPMVRNLPCKKEKDRLVVDEYFALPEHPGVWAVGDCASGIDPSTGKPYPGTAQHAMREGIQAARNIVAGLRGEAPKPFRYKTQGQLASIGRRTGVAQIFGMRFSGFFAWWLWRTLYLAKLPRWEKKIRVVIDWTLDLFFSKELTQNVTLRGIRQAIRLAKAAEQLKRSPNPEAAVAPAEPK